MHYMHSTSTACLEQYGAWDMQAYISELYMTSEFSQWCKFGLQSSGFLHYVVL